MRRLLALPLLISALACGCAAGLAAPAALAAGSGGGSGSSGITISTNGVTSPASQPGFNLSSAQQQALQSQTTRVTPVSTSSSGSGFSGLDALLTAIIAVLVLGGIAFWVWYDSRGHAATIGHGAHDSIFGERAHAGSKAPRKPRKLKPAERKRRKRGRAR